MQWKLRFKKNAPQHSNPQRTQDVSDRGYRGHDRCAPVDPLAEVVQYVAMSSAEVEISHVVAQLWPIRRWFKAQVETPRSETTIVSQAILTY